MVMAPRPRRETRRAPRCACFMSDRQPPSSPAEKSLPEGVPTEHPRARCTRPSLDAVDNRDEVKAFLTSRRARIGPEQAGLVVRGHGRRVPGLRRSEVADVAGVSVESYAKLEHGCLAGVSEAVLHAVARS